MERFSTFTVFDLLIKYITEGRIKLNRSRFQGLVMYHDPCNYTRNAEKKFGHGYYEELRWILNHCVEKWVDLYPNRLDQFCGGGALTTGYNPERIFYGRKKIEQIRASGANMVVVPCHSCHSQINSLKEEYHLPHLEVKYLWELVADALLI